MKRLLFAATLAIAASPLLAADLNMSVNVGQPGFYGRIDVGDYPAPQVIYSQPRMIHRVDGSRDPIYLRVPPGHAKNWRKHCGRYNACNERVYFVRDNWYQQQYVPRYQERNHVRQDDRRGGHRDDVRNDRRDDRGRNHRN